MSEVIYCGQCGNRNPVSNKFCGKCGAAIINLPENQETQLSRGQELTLSPNSCPKCKCIDQIQKISTITTAGTHVKSGVSTTSRETKITGSQKYYSKEAGQVGNSNLSGKAYTNSSTVINITEQSNLAKKLTPPSKPPKPVLSEYRFGVWYTIAMLIIGFLVWILSMGFLIWLEDDLGLVYTPVPLMLIISVGAGIYAMYTFYKHVKNNIIVPHQKSAKEQFESGMQKYNNALARWEKANERWDTIYYCYRDDILFVPGENTIATPDQFTEFCYITKT